MRPGRFRMLLSCEMEYGSGQKTWRERAKLLKNDVYALYFALRDPRVPWHAKLFAAAVVAYALSPIDLIPDFIPVLGYLDDLVLVPLGVAITLKMIPASVLAECREKARSAQEKPKSWLGATAILLIWGSISALLILGIYKFFH